MTLTLDQFQFLFIFSENISKINVNGQWEIVPRELFKVFFLPHSIGLEWIDIIASLWSLLRSYFLLIPTVKTFRTIIYFKLIKYITDKNIQFYIEATLRVSHQLTKKECWGHLQVGFNCRDCSSFMKRYETRALTCLQGQEIANLMIKTPAG